MLALKPPAGVESALQFVRDPVQQMWGSPAFRFESVGEAIYYVHRYQLDSKKLILCFARDLALDLTSE